MPASPKTKYTKQNSHIASEAPYEPLDEESCKAANEPLDSTWIPIGVAAAMAFKSLGLERDE